MFKLSKKSESFTPYEPLSGNFKIRLDANESFIVPSKRLEGKILRAVKEVSLNRYPDPMATELCRSFAESLKEATGLPVSMWDERRTTVEAHNILSQHNYHGKKRKNTVDAVAASLILEGYLAFRKRG